MTIQPVFILECDCCKTRTPVFMSYYVVDGGVVITHYVLRPHSHRDELAEEAERRVGEFRLEEDV